MIWKKIWAYLTFKKQESNGSVNLKMMHGINRITIFIFVFGILAVIVRRCFF